MDESTKKARTELAVSPLAHELARVAMETLAANMAEPLFAHMAVLERRECCRVMAARLAEGFVPVLARQAT